MKQNFGLCKFNKAVMFVCLHLLWPGHRLLVEITRSLLVFLIALNCFV